MLDVWVGISEMGFFGNVCVKDISFIISGIEILFGFDDDADMRMKAGSRKLNLGNLSE